MKTERHILEGKGRKHLESTVGKTLIAYRSDMDFPDRAFEAVFLQFDDFDMELRIREITDSPIEWACETTCADVREIRRSEAIAPAGRISDDGAYVPNELRQYAVGQTVRHVSVIAERTTRTETGAPVEELEFMRGFVFEFDNGFIAFDKIDPCGDAWTITREKTGCYQPPFTETDCESPELSTQASIVRIA